MRMIRPGFMTGAINTGRCDGCLAALLMCFVFLSGCATHQQPAAVALSDQPEARVASDQVASNPIDEEVSAPVSHAEIMPEIRKASNLGILFHILEVPAFTHDAGVPAHLAESLRQTVMEQMRQERLFDHVVEATPNHENTLILNARVISWDEDAVEVSLAVDTRCGCRLGEALGRGTTQVTTLQTDEDETADVTYDLLPVARGAVQYIASVMGAKHG